MVRRFFKDSALYGFATILSKGMAVLLVPVYTAFMIDSEIGLLEILLGVVAVMTLVAGLDISNALAREYGGSRDAAERKRYSSSALWFSVVVFGLAAVAVWLTADWLAEALLDSAAAAGAVRAAGVSMGMGGIYLVAVQQLRWMMRPGKFGITSVSYTCVSLGLTVIFTGLLGMGVSGVFYGMAAGAAAGLVLALSFSKGEFSLTWDGAALRRMLRFCIPLVPSSLAVVVSQYVSRFVVEAELGLGAVGVYGIGMRLAGLAGLVMLGFGSALTPLVYAAQDDPETPGNLARIFRIFAVLAALGLAGLALFTPEVQALLTKSDFSAAGPLLPWLAPAVLLVQMYIFAPGPWILRKTWWAAAINAVAAAAAGGLNWLLVPRMGLTGAAVATLLSSALHFAMFMAVSQHYYRVPHNWAALAGITAAGSAVMVTACLLPAQISLQLILLKTAVMAGLAALLILGGGVEKEVLLKARARLAARRQRKDGGAS